MRSTKRGVWQLAVLAMGLAGYALAAAIAMLAQG